MKDARLEAKREIDEYASKKEEEFKKSESQASGIYSQAEAESKKQVQDTFASIETSSQKNSDKVVDAILSITCNVK